MYASLEQAAREVFVTLKAATDGDGDQIVARLERDLESLLVHDSATRVCS
jgi:hypothetical protein